MASAPIIPDEPEVPCGHWALFDKRGRTVCLIQSFHNDNDELISFTRDHLTLDENGNKWKLEALDYVCPSTAVLEELQQPEAKELHGVTRYDLGRIA